MSMVGGTPGMAPRVSVVMPVYNVAPYVEEAVRAVLSQSFRDLELVVVDDGSTDDTPERVASCADPRVRLVRTDHAGYVAAQNAGVAAARGEYVARVDGDDIALPLLIERQVQVLDRNPQTAVVGVWGRRFGGKQYAVRGPVEPARLRRALRRTRALQQPAMYRRSAALEAGGYRAVTWEDWDLFIRLAIRNEVRNLPEYLALTRSRPASTYWSLSRFAKKRATLSMQLVALRHLGADPLSLIALAKTALSLPVYALADRVVPRREPRGAPPPASVSVVVTTYRRARRLERCLNGITEQLPPPDEVVVVHRPGDEETGRLLDRWTASHSIPLRAVRVERPGIVPALVAGTDAARGEVVAFLDDDAVPRAGWLAELRRGFLDPTVGGVGGRFVDHVDGAQVRGWTRRVGRITWYGRAIGGHDSDTDYHGDVDILPGANMAFRREVIHHDLRLRHSSAGLALANELDTCLTVRRLGHRLLYTPWALVDHYTTSYRDPQLGSRVAGRDVQTSAANYTYALLKYLSPLRRMVFLVYAFGVGSSMLPGPGRVLMELPRSRRRARAMARRIPMTWRGRVAGIRTYGAWRADGRVLGTEPEK